MALRLIADDGGATESIDKAIIRLFERKIIDGAALLTTHNPVRRYRSYDEGEALGIHLNISSGRPLLPLGEVPTLVNRNGRFHGPLDLGLDDPIRAIDQYILQLERTLAPRDIERELSAQLQQFEKEIGHGPSFVSVHHDLDRVSVIRKTAEKITGLPTRQSRLKTGELDEYSYELHPEATSLTTVIDYFRNKFTAQASRPARTVEIVCHPATSEDDLADFTIYSQQRTTEYSALRALQTLMMNPRELA